MMSDKIRDKFIDFFKKRGHVIVSSSSLVSDDPSVLLTTAGMQQFKPYYSGKADPQRDFGSKNVVSVQKSFRTSDIDEVGDTSHLTFFEMLGNFSFGGYFKAEAIAWGVEFLSDELGFAKERLSATYLKGDKESLTELKKYFSTDKIKAMGMEDNSWGPTGADGPCGPTVEFYVDGVEVWNLVFNEYYCRGNREQYLRGKAKLEQLVPPGVDTGMGLERLAAAMSGVTDVFQTDIFKPLLDLLPADFNEKQKRIVADHFRGSVFLIADGVRPSNKEAGYVLRRLIRRVITIGADVDFEKIIKKIIVLYKKTYPELGKENILGVFNEESDKFKKTLTKGLRELEKIGKLDVRAAFKLFESYGLPFEVIKDVGGKKVAGLKRVDFDKEFDRHRAISRAGLEKKFGGHGLLLDTGELKAGDQKEIEKVTRLHTATHLLQQALRDVLGDGVKQMGSDINAGRARFDFSFSRRLTDEEVKKTEQIVNRKISEDLPVNFQEMSIEKAKKTGALYYFKGKYPAVVKVYYVGKSLASAYSKEFCGGPHVARAGEIGKFKILKEEGVSAGVRRIRADVL